MKKVFSILGILLFPIAGFAQKAAERAAESRVITVMTYNIYHGEMAYDRGKSNLAEVARIINKHQPDFVALQEVDSLTGRSAALNRGMAQNLVKELAFLTSMHGFFGKAIDYDGGGYGEGVLSRYPAKAVNHALPNPEGGEGRALLTIRAEVPGVGPLLFAGTHLCHQFDANKLAQAEAILAALEKSDIPVVMGGDFNFRPDTEPYRVIRRQFADAALVNGHPENTISYATPRSRIDYIFFSPEDKWRVIDVQVLREDASDHMPVLVKLKLEE